MNEHKDLRFENRIKVNTDAVSRRKKVGNFSALVLATFHMSIKRFVGSEKDSFDYHTQNPYRKFNFIFL